MSIRAAHVAVVTLLIVPIMFAALAHAASGSGPSAADPSVEGVDALASAPFTHIDTVTFHPWIGVPIDLAIAPDGRLFVADGASRAVDVYDENGQHLDRFDAPSDLYRTNSMLIPIAVAYSAETDGLDIVWQRYGRPAGAPAMDYREAYIERRAKNGSIALEASLLPGADGPVADIAVHSTPGELIMLRGGGTTRLIGGRPDVTVTLEMTYTAGSLARVAATDERLILVHEGVALRFDLLGMPLGRLDLGSAEAVAVDRTPSGGAAVLLRKDAAIDGESIAVLGFHPSGERDPSADKSVAEIGLPPPPSAAWPWTLALGGPHIAVSSMVRGSFHAVRRDGPDPITLFARRRSSVGTPFQPKFNNVTSGLTRVEAIGGDPSGGTNVLVCLDGIISSVSFGGCSNSITVAHHLTTDGDIRDGHLLGPSVADMAVGEDGAVFAASVGGTMGVDGTAQVPSVQRFGPLWDDAVWDVPCGCRYGGRLALGSGVVYAAEPETRTIVALDAATGGVERRWDASTPLGSWPADLAADDAGRLYSADTGQRLIEAWDDGAVPEMGWTAGAGTGLGPRRIAAGRWRGASVVASLTADGRIELHDALSGGLLFGWRPELSDGSPVLARDLAFDREDRLLIAEEESDQVVVFEPVSGPWEPPGPTPGPSPTPPPSACTISGDKVAGPARVVLGETAAITLSFRADCPPSEDFVGADIVLAIVRDDAMRGQARNQEWTFLERWIEQVDYSKHRVGATQRMPDSTAFAVPLDATPIELLEQLRSRIYSRSPTAWKSAEDALQLLRETRRPDALPVIVLVDMITRSSYAETNDLRFVGNRARANGFLTYSIGLYRSSPWQREFAGSAARTFVAPAPHETAAILAHISREAGVSFAGNLVIDDTMSDDVFYEPDTARPAAIEGSGASDLRWWRSLLPTSGMTMTLRVRPLRTGIIPTNRVAVAHYDDVDGVRRQFTYPIPEIEVIAPTQTPTPTKTFTPEPTPTLTSTSTPTPTSVPLPIYLPLAVKNACVRATMPLDVALVIDVSSSMTGEKLEAAKASARAFIWALDLASGRDRAAVVAFDETARQASPLTSDGAQLERAINGLAAGLGTRIDRALAEAATVLGSAAERRTGAAAAIVLLSDGAHRGTKANVLLAAESARRTAGPAIWTIGLGPDADAALLRSVADPGAYRFAPDAAALEAVYAVLTDEIGCR